MNFSEFILGSIPVLLKFYSEMYRETDFEKTMLELESEYNVPTVKNYDFIIVGAGTAGCVLAGRLSEQFNILLLEAGGTPPPASNLPFVFPAVSGEPSINYFFKSVPQTNASLCCGGITTATFGKMLGGSGSHNGLVHARGSPRDYDNLADLLNDESFNYSNVLKYFRKMETFIGDKFGTAGDEYYGHEGPIIVDSLNYPMLDLWHQAGRELGYPIDDPNGFQRESFGPVNVAIRKGKRSSSYTEYVEPYEGTRDTLTIIRYANVSEILLDNENKAYGVAYTRHGFPQIAHANKEIIVSAGAFSSPLLLMKSGIGPESVLNAAEIPVKVPLEALGKNLVDHTAIGLEDFSLNDTSLFRKISSSEIELVLEQYHNGEGPMSVARDGAQSFIVSSKAEPSWPNLQFRMITPAIIDNDEPQISFFNILGRPKSKGIFTMDTDKYKEGIREDVQLALIDYKYLAHPDDMDAMLEGIDFIFKIIETDAFKSINLTYTGEPDPACAAFAFLTHDYWRCKIQEDVNTWIHVVGTCSLGPDSGNSDTSVVDTKFRVRGVSNLRVVDASVIPEVTNANLNAPVLMLAEKASEDILNFHRVLEDSTASADTTVSEDIFPPEATTVSEEPLPEPSGTSKLAEIKKLFLVFTSVFTFYVAY